MYVKSALVQVSALMRRMVVILDVGESVWTENVRTGPQRGKDVAPIKIALMNVKTAIPILKNVKKIQMTGQNATLTNSASRVTALSACQKTNHVVTTKPVRENA